MQVTGIRFAKPGLLVGIRASLLALALCGITPAAVDAQLLSSVSTTHSNMQKFVIIFRQSPSPLSEADKQRRQQEVSAWARVQNAAGHKLEPRILGPEVARSGTDASKNRSSPASEWPVTALLFLDATDLTEAAKIAESHPALHFDVTIEVRPWGPPNVPPTSQPVR